jgi:hypothetical protein
MLSLAYVQSETSGILPATAKPFEILMRDPEMCFELGLAGGPHLSAFHFRNDYLGVEQWGRYVVDGNYIHLIGLHKQHESFATTWDNNLRLQVFLEAFERQQTPRA